MDIVVNWASYTVLDWISALAPYVLVITLAIHKLGNKEVNQDENL